MNPGAAGEEFVRAPVRLRASRRRDARRGHHRRRTGRPHRGLRELAARYGITSTILESDSVVGGISRTVERDGWRFDIGGHRFFTKVKEVEAFWHEVLPDEDFMLRPRMSRIYYEGKYYDYPLKASNALKNLGVLESLRCVMSYARARVRPPEDQTTLEGWIVARFGWRLYQHFFKTYNEKLDEARRGTRGTGRDAPVTPRHHYGPDHPLNRAPPTPPR